MQENLTDFLHQVQYSIDTIDYYSTGAHAKIRFKHVSNIFNHETKIASTWLRYERFWRTHEATCRGWDPQVGAEKSAATVTRRFEQVVSSYIYIYRGFLKWGYPNSWMVYFMEIPIE